MAKEIIDLNKVVYNKSQYTKVIDTQFSQLAFTPSEAEIIASTPSIGAQINEFFTQYQNLFFEIPKFGQTNSHEYLIKTSGEYIGEIKIDDTLNALLEEITQLRQENLDLQQQLLQASQTTINT
jgi:hypothetical protein